MEKPTPTPKSPDAKPGQRKPAGGGGNFIWYLLALGLLLLMLVTAFSSQSEMDLMWSDFERLVKASDPDNDKAPDSIQVVDRSTSPARTLILSGMKDVVVAPRAVTGKVKRSVLADSAAGNPKALADPPEPTEVKFRVARDIWNLPLGELLTENHIPFRNAPEPNPLLQGLLWLAPMLIVFAFLIFMLRRMGGAGSPMAFGRSRGKLYAQEDIEITFDDVAGIDEAVEELREVVDFLKNPERYQRLGGRIPKGVLLVGPPGTGKTLLSKAVAGEAGVPFFSLSGSDFVEMFVGVGAARVRDMFQQAEAKAPCIIFIDELDALGKTRGSGNMGGHDEREQTLNALLVEMDGFGSNSGVIVMAATNRPETLDPALMRPGRFDRNVLVDRPDVAGREEILQVHLQKIKVDSDVDTKALAAISSGFVGADLANMVNEAALLAARNGREVVTMHEFNEAVERVGIGLEKKSRIMQEDEKQRLAIHEAGHALVAYSLPNTDPVHKVTIIPRGMGTLGYMWQRPEFDRFMKTRSQLESDIQVALGGTIAEEIMLDDIGNGATSDLQKTTETARAMVMDYGMSRLGRVNFRESRASFIPGDPSSVRYYSEQTAREIDQEVKRIIEEGIERTRSILVERRSALEAIADKLLEVETIDGPQLKEIIEQASPSPKLVPGTGSERKRPPVVDGGAEEEAVGG
ncbi:ATP-dependent zinc metalloprotease FtsH 4 [Pirellulimonas nuda]|uniref:ATP-dependent zinc metalloprotease FtsH n=2 Tax=Pirellulimonas nuda TaxID=2528009 RepID=A0A518D5E9_9BACT|nr:ATP-dependent zinc metalloprotease FtsH [Pirellulimonas nuda]QDU86698.1 ATP-dependent zinc metalloprotease FtsH 4 [Pirellulimonas nuda]